MTIDRMINSKAYLDKGKPNEKIVTVIGQRSNGLEALVQTETDQRWVMTHRLSIS